MAWLSKKNQFSILAGLIFIIALFAIVILSLKTYWFWPNRADEEERVDANTFQAVFLQGDQIYFGKLKDIDSKYPILEDVYYVKLDEPKSTTGRLVKLGIFEPHGPQDKMIINREYIIFWENLKLDSPVVQTIQNLKSNP